MSYEQQIIIQFLHKERVYPAQIHIGLEAQHGLEIYGLRSVQRWHQLFDSGCQSLKSDPRAGKTPDRSSRYENSCVLGEGIVLSGALAC
jgi:hypothetical protein